EARLAHYKKNEIVFEESINVLKLEVRIRDNALNEYKMNLKKLKKTESKTGLGYDAATTASPAVESFVNLTDKSGSDKGYHLVPPSLTGNFIPHKPDLTFMDEIVKSENLDVITVVTPCNLKIDENKDVSNTIESNDVRMNKTSALIIEDWNSDDESEIDYTVRPSTEKIKSVKTVMETQAPKQIPRGNQRNWNNLISQRLGSEFKMTNKACYVCGSFEHLHYVCDKKVERLMLGKLSTAGVAVNTVRPINTANTKAVNTVKPVNTTNTKAVNTIRSVNIAASKPIGNPQQKEYKEKGVIDSGCSRHITGNKCYLDEY
ncbi:hypothetical protein Tco_1543111, partial [Tanacetum coccineum]